MTLTLQGNQTARVAATSSLIIKGDDGTYYQLTLGDDGTGKQVLTLSPYNAGLDGTRNFSDEPVGTAFYLTGSDKQIHRFNMVNDGKGTSTYGLKDTGGTSTYPGPVEFTVVNARFDNGVTMYDLDGAGSHTLTVTGGTLTQSG